MQKKLAALGYRTIIGEEENYLLPKGTEAKGHEFHYSTYRANEDHPYAYEIVGMRKTNKEGFMGYNLVGGYTHFHFATCPTLIENWLRKCQS